MARSPDTPHSSFVRVSTVPHYEETIVQMEDVIGAWLSMSYALDNGQSAIQYIALEPGEAAQRRYDEIMATMDALPSGVQKLVQLFGVTFVHGADWMALSDFAQAQWQEDLGLQDGDIAIAGHALVMDAGFKERHVIFLNETHFALNEEHEITRPAPAILTHEIGHFLSHILLGTAARASFAECCMTDYERVDAHMNAMKDRPHVLRMTQSVYGRYIPVENCVGREIDTALAIEESFAELLAYTQGGKPSFWHMLDMLMDNAFSCMKQICEAVDCLDFERVQRIATNRPITSEAKPHTP